MSQKYSWILKTYSYSISYTCNLQLQTMKKQSTALNTTVFPNNWNTLNVSKHVIKFKAPLSFLQRLDNCLNLICEHFIESMETSGSPTCPVTT